MIINRVRPLASNDAYAVAYAQSIIDHFSKALQENGCLVQVPVALWVEIDNNLKQVEDYINSAVSAGSSPTTTVGPDNTGSGPDFKRDETYEAVAQAIRKASNDCFNCKIEKPRFDFSGMFANVTKDLKASLDAFRNMFKYEKASVCQYSYFLSYLCIPDLLKLISLILAAIVRLMQNINLPKISISAFINGILSSVIEVLTRNISILARFALTPVLCILDALDNIVSQLPTPENIRKVSKSDLEKLNVNKDFIEGKYDTGIDKKIDDLRKAYTNRIRDYETSANNTVEDYMGRIFKPLENSINEAVEHLNNSIIELNGLLNHFSCENGRSGVTVSQWLGAFSELMALANLLRYIIRFKAGKAALDRLCNTPIDGSNWGNENNFGEDELSVENIGSIIAETIESDIDLITDDDGDPIAIVIKEIYNKDEKDNTKLSFWNCNIKDFAESVTVPGIINTILEDGLNGVDIPGWKPSPWTVTVVKDSEYTKPSVHTEIVPLVIDEEWNLADHIKNITSIIDKYNGSENPDTVSEGSGVILVPDEIINEIVNKQNDTSGQNKISGRVQDSLTLSNGTVIKSGPAGGIVIKPEDADNTDNITPSDNKYEEAISATADRILSDIKRPRTGMDLFGCSDVDNDISAILDYFEK